MYHSWRLCKCDEDPRIWAVPLPSLGKGQTFMHPAHVWEASMGLTVQRDMVLRSAPEGHTYHKDSESQVC